MIPPQTVGNGCSLNSNSVTAPKFPPAAQRPEQFRFNRIRGGHDGAVRKDDLSRLEVVKRKAMQADEVADASAQGQTSHAGGVESAAWHCQPMHSAARIDTVPRSSATDAGAPRFGVGQHSAHQSQVDQEASAAYRVAGYAMATAADRHRESLLLGPGDRCGDIIAIRTARDHRGDPIDHRVERCPRDFVCGMLRSQHGSAHRLLQPIRRQRPPYHRLSVRCTVGCAQ